MRISDLSARLADRETRQIGGRFIQMNDLSKMRKASGLLAVFLVLAGCVDSVPQDPAELARQLLIVDTHIDVPYRLHEERKDVSQAAPSGDFDHPRALAGGLDAAFMSIYVPARVDAAGGAEALADELIDLVEGIVREAPDKFALATCADDLGRIKASGRIAMPLGMENGGPVAGGFDKLRRFHERGVRYVTLAHSKSNAIADSSYDRFRRWQGLSPYGKELVAEMNRLGLMVDVSHLSDQAFWQVLELSQAPVIASHSSLRHFTPGFERNLDDAMVRTLGERGGVVQISFGSVFLTPAAVAYRTEQNKALLAFAFRNHLGEDDPQLKTFAERYRSRHPYPYATLDDVLDHFDRAVALAGIDAVGIGSDFDGVGDSLPEGLKDVAAYPNLVRGLLGRGYSEEDIGKIASGNLLRAWRAVEAFAAKAGNPPQCSTG